MYGPRGFGNWALNLEKEGPGDGRRGRFGGQYRGRWTEGAEVGVVADERGERGGEVPQGVVGALPVVPEQPLGQFPVQQVGTVAPKQVFVVDQELPWTVRSKRSGWAFLSGDRG